MSQHAISYDQVLDATRKYAAGFRMFDLPTAQHALAGQLGYHPADWLRYMVRKALEQLVAEGELAVFPRGTLLPWGGTSPYREYMLPAEATAAADRKD